MTVEPSLTSRRPSADSRPCAVTSLTLVTKTPAMTRVTAVPQESSHEPIKMLFKTEAI